MTNLNHKLAGLATSTSGERTVNGFMDLYSDSLRELELDGSLVDPGAKKKIGDCTKLRGLTLRAGTGFDDCDLERVFLNPFS